MPRDFQRVAILGGARTPFVRSFTSYKKVTNQDLLTASLSRLVEKYHLKDETIGDVALGAVMVNSSDWNLARESVLGAGLNPHTPAYNIQRACGTGLEAVWQVALKIAAGQIQSGIAGGCDTNSDLPILFPREFGVKFLDLKGAKTFADRISMLLRFRPRDWSPVFPAVVERRTGLSMGQHCEKMVQEWGVPRHEQDQFALESHQKAARAYEEGFYDDLIFTFRGVMQDSILRKDSSLEKMAKLKPAFDLTDKGTLTAANSTALTDGASAVLLGSQEYARKKGLPVLSFFVDAEAAALDFVRGEGLLMAPTIAVSRMLERNNLTLQDFDYFEIHEAFAGQVLCTLRAWESPDYCKKVLGKEKPLGSIPREKINMKGGSVALGHPFGATGGRIVAGLSKILHQSSKKSRGLISICTGGGMGVAAILEN